MSLSNVKQSFGYSYSVFTRHNEQQLKYRLEMRHQYCSMNFMSRFRTGRVWCQFYQHVKSQHPTLDTVNHGALADIHKYTLVLHTSSAFSARCVDDTAVTPSQIFVLILSIL